MKANVKWIVLGVVSLFVVVSITATIVVKMQTPEPTPVQVEVKVEPAPKEAPKSREEIWGKPFEGKVEEPTYGFIRE